jgi:2-methylcitrate dehydratase PrpD
MGLTYEIAKFVKEKGYDDFSEKDIREAKNLILDCYAAMIGGSHERSTKTVIDFIKETGGVAECSVYGAGFKTSAVNAALVNGTSAHALEYESEGLLQGCLPMTIIPVALTIAEKYKLSGKAVLEGFIIGLEVSTRIGMCTPGLWGRGFVSIGLMGSLGASATACKMMKLSIDQIRNAFGNSLSQASGFQRQLGTMTHHLDTGIACRNGVMAALLAKRGMTADPNILEGENGFLELYCSGGAGYDIEPLVPSLGKPFCISSPGVNIKKYANCFFAHRAMDALVQLVEENNIRYDKVDSVQVEVPSFITRLLRFPEPENGEDAQFSLPQALGAILIDRKVDLPYRRPFTDAGAQDPKYREARKRVNVIERKDWSGGRGVPWSAPVTVNLKDGSKFTKTVDKIKGSPENPLSKEELVTRHENIVRKFLSQKQIQRSIDIIFNLENLDDISELIDLATFAKST